MKSIVSSRFRLLPLVLLSIIFLSLISSQAVQAIPTPATAPTAVTITIETFSGGPAESDGPDPSLTGEAYTVSFTVHPAVSGITPYGTVVISDGDGNTCSKTLTSGDYPIGYGWFCDLTSTNAGAKTLTATFTPADPAAFTSSSDTEPHEVYGAKVAIETFSGGPTETDEPDPSTIGESYRVSFTVKPYGVSGITPYGTMVVDDGNRNTCSRTLTSGDYPIGYGWYCNLTSTTAGPKTLTATFTPADPAVFGTLAKDTEPHYVTRASTSVSVSSSSNPSVFGHNVTFTATVSPSVATGTITFSENGNVISSCINVAVVNGQATCTTDTLSVGETIITAAYSGDANYLNSSGTLSTPQSVNCSPAITVTNNADMDFGSLRNAVDSICSHGRIDFDNDYTITLSSELLLNKDLTIDGLGHVIQIQSNGTDRVFSIPQDIEVTLDRLTIANGSEISGDGGGILVSQGNLTLINSTLLNNTAVRGGAIFNNGGTVTITNSTFSGNTANSGGGGINNFAGTLSIINVTLVDNNQYAIYNSGSFLSTNSLIYNSALPSCLNNSGSLQSASTYIEDGSCLANYSGPLTLGALGYYGGLTQSYALLPGSSVINKAATSATDTDQRGIPRVGASDLGAFESQGFTLAIVGGNNQSTDIGQAFTTPLTVSVIPNLAGEPTAGGIVSYTGPSSGASLNPAQSTATITGGQASLNATANGTGGTYQVSASIVPGNTVNFSLSNLGAPTAQVSAATTITTDTATLNGSVNPGGLSTSVVFDYGPTAALGSSIVASQSPITGKAFTSVSAALTGLAPRTTYYYQITATNASGTDTSDLASFTTIALPPFATTDAATSVDATSATLNGTVTPNDKNVTVIFEYGTSTSYGTTLTADQSPLSGDTATAVTRSLTGLAPNTTYHFRVSATNSPSTTNGEDQTFTTGKLAPTATTGAATNIGTTTATLNGAVTANNDETSVYFEYGLDLTYGSTKDADQSPLNGLTETAVSADLTGLVDNSLYHYRVVTTNSAGTTFGADQTFTTDYFPGATISQGILQADPTNATPIFFKVIFDKAINPTTFTSDDLDWSGSTTVPVTVNVVEVALDNYDIVIMDVPTEGTITVSLPAGRVKDLLGNPNLASTSTDNQVTYDLSGPTVAGSSLKSTYTVKGPASFSLTFDESLNNPPGSTDPDDVTNPANYLLVEMGDNHLFDTVSCAAGLTQDDTQILISSVAYDDLDHKATLTLASEPPIGSYRLFVCGTTSLCNLVGLPLNNGVDDVHDFSVLPAATILPETGFAPATVTPLSGQPDEVQYGPTDLVLSIPGLGVEARIIGIPQTNTGWNISWLGDRVGYLYGSAYPTWEGNTILTGHTWNADGSPGPFKDLKSLRYGDRVTIESNGTTYIYEVRESNLVSPTAVDSVFQSEERDWVTLITCEYYNPLSGEYTLRRVIRAVLVIIE